MAYIYISQFKHQRGLEATRIFDPVESLWHWEDDTQLGRTGVLSG